MGWSRLHYLYVWVLRSSVSTKQQAANDQGKQTPKADNPPVLDPDQSDPKEQSVDPKEQSLLI